MLQSGLTHEYTVVHYEGTVKSTCIVSTTVRPDQEWALASLCVAAGDAGLSRPRAACGVAGVERHERHDRRLQRRRDAPRRPKRRADAAPGRHQRPERLPSRDVYLW